MRFAPFLVLFLCLYQCKGAPPGESATKLYHSRGSGFTDEEDALILEELSRLSVDKKLKMFSKRLWKHIEQKHREKWEQKAPGFPQERSHDSLFAHYRRMVKYNFQKIKSKVPESLSEVMRQDLNKSLKGVYPPYTPQEEEFIIEELSKPSCISPLSLTTLSGLSEKHAGMSQHLTPGFENERTASSLRGHVGKMKKRGKLPDAVLKKVRKYKDANIVQTFSLQDSGASSSNPTTSNQQTDLEVSNEDDNDEWVQ